VHSTPDYPAIAAQAVHDLGGHLVFAGPRADAFHVDLGSIFDLGDLRPFQSAYNPAIPPILPNMPGVNGLRGLNVHTIAIQVPITELTRDHTRPTDVMSPTAVIGVYATASRTSAMVRNAKTGTYNGFGGSVQVSRLGNPLINEVINPMSVKDLWNTTDPADDQQFAQYVYHPELANLIANVLYPSAFPRLRQFVNANRRRNDLAAILLTGIPAGVVPGFQNFTGTTQADMLRLNVAIPPAKKPDITGILGGDLAGFPNGRRVQDDIVTIELRAIAGVTYPLIDSHFTPDAAAGAVTDGVTPPGNVSYLSTFPYLDHPVSGYDVKPPRR
jgi:hypothetical protein